MSDESGHLEHPLVRSYRELLCIERGASAEELQQAYRSMAKVYHPDAARNEENEVFLKIREAYEVLTDAGRIHSLNEKYLKGHFAQRCVDHLELKVGSFFGHRFVRISDRNNDPDVYDWTMDRPRMTITEKARSYYKTRTESVISILDDPKLDLMEVIFAGCIEQVDERRLVEAFRKKDFTALPWFVLNNEGICHFLDGRYEEALLCYDVLNRRVGQNIVFLFRLGLCHEILAFRDGIRVGGKILPVANHFHKATRYYRQAIRIGANRVYAPQQCLSVRKTLADMLQSGGRRWQSWLVWRRLKRIDPQSVEADKMLQQTKPRIAGLLGTGK